LALVVTTGCKTSPAASDKPGQAAGEVLAAFIAAAEARDFERAYLLLCGALRARYTPDRLQRDFDNEPLARERLERARQALRQEATLRGDFAEFPLGAGKAVRLVREDGSFRVASLE
jgi:hypothetical protein